MVLRLLSTTFVAWMLIAGSASAQPDRSRVMGMVLDDSGGALPGVTVTLAAGSAAPITVISDGTGRYFTAWIAPGTYTITFVLAGFETRTAANVRLARGETVVLDQQMGLDKLTETVEVRAAAPEPPAPKLPRVKPPAPPKPVPVDKELLASVCGPRQPPEYSLAIGHVVKHSDSDRELLGPGDRLRIDAGEKNGLAVGQNLVVRRRFHTGDRYAPKKEQTFGEQTLGLVQILQAQGESSMAMIVYACGEIMAGDTIERYVPQPQFFAVHAGTPNFDDPAKVTIGEFGQTAATAGQMMVIDRGIMQSIQRGQQLTIFRRPGGDAMPISIGDGVVVAVRADSATIRIERATDAIVVGDLVALHR
jgi:hypothetical protein